MKQVKAFAEQVLKKIDEMKQRLLRSGADSSNDTVENQAQAFRIWIWSSAAALFCGVVVFAFSQKDQANESGGKSVAREEFEISDRIPDGWVLVPIEPANMDALDSLFGARGYVDIYRAGGDTENADNRRALIKRGVAMMRTPRNPRRFAALIAEDDIATLKRLGEPVHIVVRKRPPSEKKRHGGAVTKLKPRRGVQIIEEYGPKSADAPGAASEIDETNLGGSPDDV